MRTQRLRRPTLAAVRGARAVYGHSGGAIELVELEKRFGEFTAVDGIDLSIGAGEFFSLLGPSGCGKTTTLRLIVGFEQPTSGRSCSTASTSRARRRTSGPSTPCSRATGCSAPHRRGQHRLRPALAARRREQGRARRSGSATRSRGAARRAGEAQARAALRWPAAAGRRSRAALVLKPSVLLLDEPLGALDAKLRKALQHELTGCNATSDITFVYVTHDQEEALTMSDRLAVMGNGHVSQVGPPLREVYTNRPTPTSPTSSVSRTCWRVKAVGAAPLPAGYRRHARRHRAALRSGDDPTGTGSAKIVIRPERARIVESRHDR